MSTEGELLLFEVGFARAQKNSENWSIVFGQMLKIDALVELLIGGVAEVLKS